MKVIAVASGKGGTGKSCVAAYTGAALGKTAKTLLVETGERSLDLIIGAQDKVVYDIHDVLEGKCDPEAAVVPGSLGEGLYLMPGGVGRVEADRSKELEILLEHMRRQYEYVLLDYPGLGSLNPRTVDTVLLVTTPDSLSIRACSWKARELFERGFGEVRLVINNVPVQVLPMYGAEDFDDVIDIIGTRLIAVIPASPRLQYSANNGQPLSDESLTPQVFRNLGARLRGEKKPLLVR